MLITIFIILQMLTLAIFFTAFFTHQEILWAISAVMTGMLMYSSFYLETYVYEFDVTLGAYAPILTANNYPYLMGLNMLFFCLTILLGLFDLFDKYGLSAFKPFDKKPLP